MLSQRRVVACVYAGSRPIRSNAMYELVVSSLNVCKITGDLETENDTCPECGTSRTFGYVVSNANYIHISFGYHISSPVGDNPDNLLLIPLPDTSTALTPSFRLPPPDPFFLPMLFSNGPVFGGHSPSSFQPCTSAWIMSLKLMGTEGVRDCRMILE